MSYSSYDHFPMSPTPPGFAVATSLQVLHAFACRTSDTEAQWCWTWEGGAGTHLTIFVSFFLSFCQCPSSAHLCYWKPSWCSPRPPSESPHSSQDPSIAFPLLLYHSGSLHPISTLIFLCIKTKISKSTLPTHQDFQESFLYVGEWEKSRTEYCLHVWSSKVTTNVKTGKRLLDLVTPSWRNPSQKQDKVTSQPSVSWLTMTSSTDLNNQQFLPNIVFRKKRGNIPEF